MINRKYYIIVLLFVFCNISNAQNNYLMFLNNPQDAALARAKIVEKAQDEILISYYIFEDDAVGLVGLDLLLLKKERSPDIKIKILIDAQSNRVDKSLLYYLEQHGIEIKEFHPLPKLFVPLKDISIPDFFNALNNFSYRMHDKLIIADEKEIIAGGRNIENSYYGLDERNFHDRDFYFYSKSLAIQVRDYFMHMWNSKHTQKIVYRGYYKSGKHYNKMVNKLKNIRNFTLFNLEKYQKETQDLDPLISGLKFRKAIFLNSYNKVTGSFDPEYLSTSLFNLSLKLKKSMLIETPYLLPTKRLYKLMKYLESKNVKMEFVTNSYCSSDAMPVVAAYDNEKENLADLGVVLFEYKGPDYLHAKSAVFDDKFALVGSYNMDPRSAYINTELVFIIDDENIAKKLKEIIYKDKENCVKVEEITQKQVPGGYYNCSKSGRDIFAYVFFRLFSRLPVLYYQF